MRVGPRCPCSCGQTEAVLPRHRRRASTCVTRQRWTPYHKARSLDEGEREWDDKGGRGPVGWRRCFESGFFLPDSFFGIRRRTKEFPLQKRAAGDHQDPSKGGRGGVHQQGEDRELHRHAFCFFLAFSTFFLCSCNQSVRFLLCVGNFPAERRARSLALMISISSVVRPSRSPQAA